MVKDLKETVVKEAKKGTVAVSHPGENVSKVKEAIEKGPSGDSGVCSQYNLQMNILPEWPSCSREKESAN
jgi:hypothetical protein